MLITVSRATIVLYQITNHLLKDQYFEKPLTNRMPDEHHPFERVQNLLPQELHLVANLRLQPAILQSRVLVITRGDFRVTRVGRPLHQNPRRLAHRGGELVIELYASGIPRYDDEAGLWLADFSRGEGHRLEGDF